MRHRINWTAIIVALMLIAGSFGMMGWVHSWSDAPARAESSTASSPSYVAPTPEVSPAETAPSPSESASSFDQFVPSGSVGTPVNTTNVGSWQVQEMKDLATNPIVGSWINRLKNPAPQLWKTYPNVPNQDVPGFRVVPCQGYPDKKCVPDGAEYGTYSWPFCQLDICNVIVPAREYVLITGDYRFLDLSCGPQKGVGCLLLIFNVGDQSYEWKHQAVDAGFAVHGRYWNGDVLEWAAWGLVSNASANMLNMPTSAHPSEPLNFGNTGSNAGANCSSPAGCNTVDATIVVAAGSNILAVLHTAVNG